MSFLLRFRFTMSDGEVVHDETVVADLTAIEAIEKEIWIVGTRGTLRIDFDPPLVVRTA